MIDEYAHKRLDSVESRLETHLELIQNLQESIKENTTLLAENTKLTRENTSNTSEIVDLLKGGRVFGKLVLWLASISGAVAALWAVFKYIARGE